MARERPAVERVHPPDALMRLINPVTRRILTSRFHAPVSDLLLVLHFTGRKSGRRYDTPVGHHMIDGHVSLLTSSGWRVNFRGGRPVEVTLRGRRRPAIATLIEDPYEVATTYRRTIDRLGLRQAQRRLGIRIKVDRVPTEDEIADMVRRSGLSIVRLDIDPESAP